MICISRNRNTLIKLVYNLCFIIVVSKIKSVLVAFTVISFLLIVDACRKNSESANEQLTIRLKWNQGFSGEPYSNVETGLLWSLSYLGAEMPKGSLSKTVVMLSDNIIELKLYNAGFNSHARMQLSLLIDAMKHSEEYASKKAIDIGRFLMLTLYSSYNYYSITNTESSFNQFSESVLTDTKFSFAVTNSAISSNERIIYFSPVSQATRIGFIADDGTGSIEQGDFEVEAHECWTVMKNGQLRYAIYNTSGALLACSTSEAGKPGKCMWCHEIAIQPLINPSTGLSGFLTPLQFSSWLGAYQSLLDNYRQTLHGEIDFSKTQDHTIAELLYIAFMEPSIYRLSQEWEMTESEVLQKLNGLPTHINGEYPWMGAIYDRKDVDGLAPYNHIQISDDARECSSYEPDFFYLTH